ncbi:MAG: HD domain-containing phosphohydrolase [Planctomycetota bacterium]
MALLRVTQGELAGKTFPLTGEKMVIGRESDVLPVLDQGVSRQHAEIFHIGELYFIRDLGSRNGTFLNENRVADQDVLRHGDRVHVGNTVMVFEDSHAQRSDSRVIRYGDSVDKPGSTLSLNLPTDRPPKMPARGAETTRLQALYQVSRILGTGDDPRTIFENVVREMSEILNSDHVYLFEYHRDGETEFTARAHFDRIPASDVIVSRSILRRVRDEGRPVLSKDALLDERFSSADSIIAQQLKSILCVPLLVANRPIGAIYATNTKISEAFSPEDLEFAAIIGMIVGNALEMWEVIANQGRAYRDVLKIISSVAEFREAADRGRSERVATYAAAIARELGHTPKEIRNIWVAAMLHDVGAIALSEQEIQNAVNLEQRKAKLARELLERTPELAEVAPIILGHTERLDGSGFPEGASGDAVDRRAQIVGLACELEQLLTHGESSGELSAKRAMVRIRDVAEAKFLPEVVRALLRAYRSGALFQADKTLFEMVL